MTPAEYAAAVRAAGVSPDLPVLEQDRRVAKMLLIDPRTARRYRRGEVWVPGPVQVALRCLAKLRKEHT